MAAAVMPHSDSAHPIASTSRFSSVSPDGGRLLSLQQIRDKVRTSLYCT